MQQAPAFPGSQDFPGSQAFPAPAGSPTQQGFPASPAFPASGVIPPAPGSDQQPAPLVPAESPLPPMPSVPAARYDQSGLNDETVVDEESVHYAPNIVFDDGEEFSLTAPMIIGRRPQPNDAFAHAELKAIPDTSMRMSKTHAAVYASESDVWVQDLDSRNGVIFEIDGQKTRIPVGVKTAVPDGTHVHLGGRSFTVVK